MPLIPGARLGPYEIVSPLGAGGMGEVYRARDTRLHRDVAIKALTASFSTDPDRRARFEREAQTLASLKHPNIAQIYGLETAPDDGASGVAALVMELVEGEDLAARVKRGALPVEEVVAVTRQIAEGLEAAHDLGIIHRDLKPANVMVQPDGTAKILDFGLAKSQLPDGATSAIAATFTSPAMTAAGVILGTAAYMAPEQARGKPVDRRADIWAFGCVLYELLAGKPAFEGETVSDTISAILRGDPDWSKLPAGVPQGVVALIEQCLVKDVRQRMPHIGVARLALSTPAITTSPVEAPVAAVAPRSRLAWGLAAVGVAVAMGLGATLWLQPPVPEPITAQFELRPPIGTTRFGSDAPARGTNPPAPHHAVSPDGRLMAFVAVDDKGPNLWVQPLASTTARLLPDTDQASFPFWSPDGRSIAFFARGQLRRISLDESRASTICPAEAGEGGTWGPDGTIVFAPTTQSALWRVPAGGGTPVPVSAPDADEYHRWPQYLAEGKTLLYLSVKGPRSVARLLSLSTGSAVDIVETPSRAFAADGHVLFNRNGQLMAQPFNETTGAVSGEPRRVVEDVAWSTGNSRAGFHVAAGVLVHRRGSGGMAVADLVWRDRAGRVVSKVVDSDRYSAVVLAPDGDRVVAVVSPDGPGSDLWMIDLARAVRTRLTSAPGFDGWPLWLTDKELVYGHRTGPTDPVSLWRIGAGAATAPQPLPATATGALLAAHPSGSFLLVEGVTDPGPDVVQLPLDGAAPVPVLTSAFSETNALFSPDGTLLAYQSNEAGTNDIYVQPWPLTGDKWRISPQGGRQPLWRPDGRELFFLGALNELHAVSVTRVGSQVVFGDPTVLMPGVGSGTSSFSRAQYAVTRDGQRILTIEPTDAAQANLASPLVVTINWQGLMK